MILLNHVFATVSAKFQRKSVLRYIEWKYALAAGHSQEKEITMRTLSPTLAISFQKVQIPLIIFGGGLFLHCFSSLNGWCACFR